MVKNSSPSFGLCSILLEVTRIVTGNGGPSLTLASVNSAVKDVYDATCGFPSCTHSICLDLRSIPLYVYRSFQVSNFLLSPSDRTLMSSRVIIRTPWLSHMIRSLRVHSSGEAVSSGEASFLGSTNPSSISPTPKKGLTSTGIHEQTSGYPFVIGLPTCLPCFHSSSFVHTGTPSTVALECPA